MPEITAEDIQRAVATELRKHGGSSERTLADFVTRDARRRERIRQLTEENDALKKDKPADGSVVLSGDEAKRWTAFDALKKTPEEIAAALTKGEEAMTTLAALGKKDQARDAASVAGFDNPDAFLALPGALDLVYEVRTEKVDGEDVKRAYVKVGTDTKLLDMDFVESRADWKALKGALGATDESTTKDQSQAEPRYTPDRVEKGGKGKKATEETFRKATEATATYQL